MNAEVALLEALTLCEEADLHDPAERVVAIVAKQYDVDPGELLDLWLRKQYHTAQARDAIKGERTGAA
jgi:hypothetical protein